MSIQIKIENLLYRINSKIIIDHLSYTFESGWYVLQGASGCGKTTLLNILAGYLQNYIGTVSISKGTAIGYMYQEDMLFSNLTVRENIYIKYCAIENRKETLQYIQEHTMKKFGLDHIMDEKVKFLSGGERQRLQFAMISVDNPDIILLDEPFSKLDVKLRDNLMEQVMNEWSNKLVIIVSHDKIETTKRLSYLNMREGRVYEM